MLEMIRKRFAVWLALQQLSWMALWRDPAVLALSLKQAVIEREVADQGSEEELMRQAFANKLAGKTNKESFAMMALMRRHGL